MNLPKDFESYFRERWEAEAVDALIHGLQGEPSVSIRLNPARLPLDAEPEGADGHVPWCPEGIYLKSRPAFTADPLLHAGAYYVQEASSMFLAHILSVNNLQLTVNNAPSSEQELSARACSLDSSRTVNCQLSTVNCQLSPATCLDLCAAPGGKSTLLRSLLPDDCLLVSNEPVRARAQVLAENMAKWGHPNVLVTQAYAADIAEAVCRGGRKKGGGRARFDLILADVPCSGEGMMRKEEEAVRQWSPAFVSECAALQRSIIADIWPALRPGGHLIYSTCTFNPEEDEDNVEWIARELGADIIPIPIDPAWHIRGDRTLHFLPGEVRGEGFFCALLKKHGEEDSSAKNTDFIDVLSALNTLPTDLLDSADAPRVELSLEEAHRYLQREALVLPPDTPRGIVQVCYRGQRLGLMKNIGTRANNLYPKEWRIRTTHLIPHSLFD